MLYIFTTVRHCEHTDMQWNATAANVATCEMFMISALITEVHGTVEN